MQVPLEIVGQIIAYVEESSSLRACSLVDRAWLPFTRELLYKKVLISPSEEGRAKIEFFEQSPHLAPYVRTLSVICRPSSEIVSAVTRLPIIFPNTEDLSLMGLPRVQWTALPSEFTESFQQLVGSGLLKRLYLTWFRFQEEPDVLGDLLRSCSSTLETLRLQNLHNPIDITLIAPGEAPEISFPELSTLALASVATSSPTSSYRLATPNLKFLSWESTITTLPYLINILPRSSMATVTTFKLSLSLDPSPDNPYAVPPVPPGFFPDAWCLPDVRTLTIAMRYPTFDNDNPLDTALSYVALCLQQIPNFDVIETINIEFSPDVTESPSWKHLDAVLADIQTHGSLKSVVIHPFPTPVWLPHCAVLKARDDEE
ncbi:F-box domain-containing protein [Pleurotus pulmonarius]